MATTPEDAVAEQPAIRNGTVLAVVCQVPSPQTFFLFFHVALYPATYNLPSLNPSQTPFTMTLDTHTALFALTIIFLIDIATGLVQISL